MSKVPPDELFQIQSQPDQGGFQLQAPLPTQPPSPDLTQQSGFTPEDLLKTLQYQQAEDRYQQGQKMVRHPGAALGIGQLFGGVSSLIEKFRQQKVAPEAMQVMARQNLIAAQQEEAKLKSMNASLVGEQKTAQELQAENFYNQANAMRLTNPEGVKLIAPAAGFIPNPYNGGAYITNKEFLLNQGGYNPKRLQELASRSGVLSSQLGNYYSSIGTNNRSLYAAITAAEKEWDDYDKAMKAIRQSGINQRHEDWRSLNTTIQGSFANILRAGNPDLTFDDPEREALIDGGINFIKGSLAWAKRQGVNFPGDDFGQKMEDAFQSYRQVAADVGKAKAQGSLPVPGMWEVLKARAAGVQDFANTYMKAIAEKYGTLPPEKSTQSPVNDKSPEAPPATATATPQAPPKKPTAAEKAGEKPGEKATPKAEAKPDKSGEIMSTKTEGQKYVRRWVPGKKRWALYDAETGKPVRWE